MKNLGMVSGVPRVAVKAHSASCAAAFAQVALKGNFKNHKKIADFNERGLMEIDFQNHKQTVYFKEGRLVLTCT